MNPYFVSVVIGVMLDLKRTCPKCMREQARKRRESVHCKFCGADIVKTSTK